MTLGIPGLEEIESKHILLETERTQLALDEERYIEKSADLIEVPNIQSAFRVSRSALFAHNEETCVAKRQPQNILASIEDLACSKKMQVTQEMTKNSKKQTSLAQNLDSPPFKDENVHPNIQQPPKIDFFPLQTQAIQIGQQVFGQLSRPPMQPIQLNHPFHGGNNSLQ